LPSPWEWFINEVWTECCILLQSCTVIPTNQFVKKKVICRCLMLGFKKLSNAQAPSMYAFTQEVQLVALNIPCFGACLFNWPKRIVSCMGQILSTCFRGVICHFKSTGSVHVNKQVFSFSFLVRLINI
jgi:hypothetical protein